jgi:hypothetical protein
MIDLGVNPAGVEVVVHMAKKMADMQKHIDELTSELEQLKPTRHTTKKSPGKRG